MSRRPGRYLLLIAVGAVALSGCQSLRQPKLVAPVAPVRATPPPPPPPPRVVVLPAPPAPPPKSCVPRTFPGPPRYPDTDGALRAAPGAADRYQLMAAGRILRQQRLEELERAVAACR
jgi:hypothetical protein